MDGPGPVEVLHRSTTHGEPPLAPERLLDFRPLDESNRPAPLKAYPGVEPVPLPRELRSGTVGHNAFRTDFGMAFGGFKQSGFGREGGKEGLLPFLETKAVILEGTPQAYAPS